MTRLLVPLALALTMAGCAPAPRPTPALTPGQPPAAPHQPAATTASRPTGALTEASLYQMEASWTDQNGRTIHLADLRGRPQLVAMGFTACAHACPATIHEMKRVLAGLDEPARRAVGLVLVSLDPEHDTPEALRAFAARMQLDPAQWTLLRGDAADVREFSALLGIRYAKNDDGSIAHTNVLTVLDREGATRYRQEGLGGDVSSTVVALQQVR